MLLPALVLLASALAARVAGCPTECTCKWKAGKEWVECARRNLQGLPRGAREETQVLDLSGNNLLNLNAEGFLVLRLVNLQRLYVARSRIGRIASGAFIGLQGLVELDLAENELVEVPSDTFGSIGNLMRLNLAGNPITRVERNGFRHLTQLTFLDLSKCHLRELEDGAFSGLHALEWLKLNDNRLATLGSAVLPRVSSLRGLPLHGNPWSCDCRLLGVRVWLDEWQTQAPQESDPVCAEPPRLHARVVRAIKLQEFACKPRIVVRERLEAYEGDNVTLECEVEANPPAALFWLVNGERIDADPAKEQRLRYTESSSKEKVTSTLEIINVEQLDEGSYACQAENPAGSTRGNASLRILRRERSTVEPPPENPGAGYAAAIAAGALLGTLLALGCLFLGIFLYARRLRTRGKSNLKEPPPASSLVPPSILKKPSSATTMTTTSGEIPKPGNNLGSASVHCTSGIPEGSILEPEFAEMAYLEQPGARRVIEPDLINEVPSEGGYHGLGYHRPDSYSSCLDRDGYPLNFGLPKLGPMRPRAGETLPRIRHRQHLMMGGSAALPATRFSREAEFLARGPQAYPAPPVLEIGYAAVVPAPFLPSPPAAYRTEPAALSPRSLLQGKTHLEGAIGGLPRIGSPNLLTHPPAPELPVEVIDHPESPDEGYVGDAMDV